MGLLVEVKVWFRVKRMYNCIAVLFLPRASLFILFFCVFRVFSFVYFELSVPVQVIAWKHSSPK